MHNCLQERLQRPVGGSKFSGLYMSDPQRNRAWVELDPAALRNNFDVLRRTAGAHAGVLVMVKADGYGLGARWVVETLEPLGPAAWGVATVAEGVALRGWGVTRDIIVFGPMPPAEVERAAAHRLIATLSSLDALHRWVEAGRRHGGVRFHAEVDTGMGRAGFLWSEWPAAARALAAQAGPQARWEGLYTHFHSADSADPGASEAQWARFREAVEALPVPRGSLRLHTSNSAAALRWPEWAGDLVRAGVYLYGGQPADPALDYPRPHGVAAVRARIVLVREVPAGTTVGYGATHVAEGRERWATLAIGYGDGLPRALGNRGCALVRGQRVPIVGRISMDMTVVNITGLEDVDVGEVATLIGQDGEGSITVDEVAALADTISYEILTGLTPRLPRVERERE